MNTPGEQAERKRPTVDDLVRIVTDKGYHPDFRAGVAFALDAWPGPEKAAETVDVEALAREVLGYMEDAPEQMSSVQGIAAILRSHLRGSAGEHEGYPGIAHDMMTLDAELRALADRWEGDDGGWWDVPHCARQLRNVLDRVPQSPAGGG